MKINSYQITAADLMIRIKGFRKVSFYNENQQTNIYNVYIHITQKYTNLNN